MRQRTLGIIAGALLAGGAALGAVTGIVAYRTATSPSAVAHERVPARHQQAGQGNLEPRPGFRQPGGRPDRQPRPGGGF
jgi:hypothetical protein